MIYLSSVLKNSLSLRICSGTVSVGLMGSMKPMHFINRFPYLISNSILLKRFTIHQLNLKIQGCCLGPQIGEFLKRLSVAWHLKRVKTFREVPGVAEKICQATDNHLRNSSICCSRQLPWKSYLTVPLMCISLQLTKHFFYYNFSTTPNNSWLGYIVCATHGQIGSDVSDNHFIETPSPLIMKK